ncbi:MAG TPA: apolipoprotein N-acyltransferase [Acidobacteriota bacterium]|nr:apolipoprotein N-acyltransferase [Acidobacteriota bacterium]
MELRRRAALAAAAIVTGLLSVVLYAPYGFWPLGWLCLVPLLWAVASARTTLGAVFLGLTSGLVFRLFSIPWVVHTMMVHGSMPLPAAIGTLLLLSLYLSLYPATVAFLLRSPLKRYGPVALLLAPFLWVSGELLQTYLITGFPWSLLGYSQIGFLPAIQIADITGVYGVSFVLVAFNAAVVFLLLRRREIGRREVWQPLAVVAALVIAVFTYGFVKAGDESADGEPFDFVILQDDLTNAERPRSATREGNELFIDYFGRTIDAARTGAEVIIWAEGTMVFLDMNEDSYKPWDYELDIYALARDEGFWLLMGSNDYYEEGAKLHNSAVTVSPFNENKPAGRYDKVHLTPFGEYVPYQFIFGWVPQVIQEISDFDPGDEIRPIPLRDGLVGVPICYEIIFPDLVRRFVAKGAGLLVTISNDAWFGISAANEQHFDHGVLRAVENRRWLLRCAATGVSGIVAPNGRVLQRTPIYERKEIRGTVAMRSGRTLYAAYGDIFSYVCFLFSASILASLRYNRGSRAGRDALKATGSRR